jgi:hypothetical protein
MKAYRRLIAVLGTAAFFLCANALMHERDTNDAGPLLKLPLDIYEPRKSAVILVGLLTICPLVAVVNHLGWIIARNRGSDRRLRRLATLDEMRPTPGGPESAVYSSVFAFIYHLFPSCVATHLFIRLFYDAPKSLLWDFSLESLISGNHARFEGISFYGWMTPLLIVLYGFALVSFVRLAIAVLKPATNVARPRRRDSAEIPPPAADS